MTQKLIGFLSLACAMLIAGLAGHYVVAGLSAVGWGIYIAETTKEPTP